MELPSVVELFATAFDELPQTIEGTPGTRMLIAPGLLFRTYVVYGVLTTEEVVELIGITIDH